MQKVARTKAGTAPGTLNIALFQLLALKMPGGSKYEITAEEQWLEDMKKKISKAIKNLPKGVTYDQGTRTYTRTNKKPPLSVSEDDVQNWDGKNDNVLQVLGVVKKNKKGYKSKIIENKTNSPDGKFGPGTYQNLPWGKVNATMLVEQQKTTTKTNITIEMSLESSKNDPTTELPVVDSQKEIEPLPIITGTTKLHSEGMYALNQRDKLNILIAREQTPSPFKGITPAEFINDLVDLKNY